MRYQAELDKPSAQYYMGIVTEVLDKDYPLAAMWYARAAAHGISEAESSLAYIYENGLGFDKDEEVAYTLYKRAADHGLSSAKFKLGKAYIEGVSLDGTPVQGLHYLNAAANENYPPAQGYLALIYFEGKVVPQNLQKAREWAVLAKKNDAPYAELILDEVNEAINKK